MVLLYLFFMSKVDFLRLGGWDENYEQGMVADWDFFLKCKLSGLKNVKGIWLSFLPLRFNIN
jgi:hypothetical protein